MGLIDKVDVVVNGAQDSSKALVEYNTVILKQNIRDSRNMLTQQMMSHMNTKYVIKWAYTLAENIVLPKNCLIEFDGGSIKNDKGNSYTLTGDNTILIYSQELEDVVKGVELEGTFIHKNCVVADEEDLTVEHSDLLGIDTLKLANRDNTNGMGYVILRKNKSFKEQITKENTIYEIRYDFDIQTEEVEIPAGCVLKFNGGKLVNGSIKFNGTLLEGNIKIYTLLSGYLNMPSINIMWFISDIKINIADRLYNIIYLANANKSKIIVPAGEYIVDNLLLNDCDLYIEGQGQVFIRRTSNRIIELYNGGNIYISNINFKGDNIRAAGIDIETSNNIIINNCNFSNFGLVGYSLGYALPIDAIYLKDNKSVVINNISIDGAERMGIANVRGEEFVVRNSSFKNCGWYAITNDGQDDLITIMKHTEYLNNYIKDCKSGGLHCEATYLKTPTSEQTAAGYPHCCDYVVIGNIIKNCGTDSWGTDGGCAITAGNYTNSIINNNTIINWSLQKGAIQLSRPKSAIISNNNIDGTKGIIYGATNNTILTDKIIIRNNHFSIKILGIYLYNISSDNCKNLIIDGNSFNIEGGKGFEFDLVNTGIAKNNIFESSNAETVAIKLERGSIALIENNVLSTLTQDLYLPPTYRNNTFYGNRFKTSNVQNVRFDINSGNIIFYEDPGVTYDIKEGDIIKHDNLNVPDEYCYIGANADNQTPAKFSVKLICSEYFNVPDDLELKNKDRGFMFYDITRKKYILWNGSSWTNIDGTSL